MLRDTASVACLPARWLDEGYVAALPPCAYMPFSKGPRWVGVWVTLGQGPSAPLATSVRLLPSLPQPQCMMLSKLGHPLKTPQCRCPWGSRTSVRTEGW
jgi:hypothetical protein